MAGPLWISRMVYADTNTLQISTEIDELHTVHNGIFCNTAEATCSSAM